MTPTAAEALELARRVVEADEWLFGPGEAEFICRAILAIAAENERMRAVVEAAEQLSAVMYVGEGEGTSMRGLWCSIRNGHADHAGLMLDLRARLAALRSPSEGR